jgi:hypothetical protein
MAPGAAAAVTVVALGGGTGLPGVLMALRRYLPADCGIAAIVTAADDGGSSGVLRKEYGVLPPGDIRNCLIALARVAPEVSAALQYRFDGGVAAHPVGNLLLTALDLVSADEVTAIRLAAELLGVDDLILPSTTWMAARFTVSPRSRGAARRSSASGSILPTRPRRPACSRPCAMPTRSSSVPEASTRVSSPPSSSRGWPTP